MIDCIIPCCTCIDASDDEASGNDVSDDDTSDLVAPDDYDFDLEVHFNYVIALVVELLK